MEREVVTSKGGSGCINTLGANDDALCANVGDRSSLDRDSTVLHNSIDLVSTSLSTEEKAKVKIDHVSKKSILLLAAVTYSIILITKLSHSLSTHLPLNHTAQRMNKHILGILALQLACSFIIQVLHRQKQRNFKHFRRLEAAKAGIATRFARIKNEFTVTDVLVGSIGR
jgi:hypothetical protein